MSVASPRPRLRLDPLEDRAVPAFLQLGSTGNETLLAMGTDPAGNIYVGGTFNGTVDFDPGPGNTSLTAGGGSDADGYLAKYSPAGALLWVGHLPDSSVSSVAIGPDGTAYAAGFYRTAVDMDLGPGTSILTTGAAAAGFVAKYAPDRSLVWARGIGGQTSTVTGDAVAVDAAGNVYAAGFYGAGAADMDPGPGTVTFNNPTVYANVFVSKLDPTGNLGWARPFETVPGAPGGIFARDLGVDAAQNVYVTGNFFGVADFDPSGANSNTQMAGTSGGDGFVAKLTAAGDLGYAVTIAAPNARDDGSGIAVAPDGTAYVTGSLTGTALIDATSGDASLTSAGSLDPYALRLDPAGGLGWAKRYGGANGDNGMDVVFDGGGRVYLSGYFQETADFDPGPGVFTLTAGGVGLDAFTLALGTDGSFDYAWGLLGPGGIYAYRIALMSANELAVAGPFTGTVDFDPGPGVLNRTSVGGDDAYVATIPVGNQPPGALNGGLSTTEDTPAPGLLTATDSENDPLIYSLVDTTNAHGTVTITDPTTGAYTYAPDANYFGPAGFKFRANDGGTDSNTATISVTVSPVNDPPSFVGGPDQSLNENTGQVTVPGWATGLSAGPPNETGQTLTFTATTDNDELFAVLPAIAPNGTLTFTPVDGVSGTATVTVTLSDNGGTANGGIDTSAPQTFTITVDLLNDAPILTGDAELTPIPRNVVNPFGDRVGDFTGPSITDPDVNPLQGIAIVGTTGTQGTWQYSIDNGQAWLPLGTPAESAARLLRDVDRVRFVPAAGFVGTVTLTYRAWDQTAGVFGESADLTGGIGGRTAFSSATAAARLQVGITLTPVPEDAKSAKGDKVSALLGTFVTDPDLKAKSGIVVVSVDNAMAGTWQYSTTGGRSWKALTASPVQALLLRSSDKVRYFPAPNVSGFGSLRFHAWDQTVGKAGTRVILTSTGGGTAFSTAHGVGFAEVTAVNDAPILDVGGEPPLTRVAPTETDPGGDLVKDLIGPAATDAEGDSIGMTVLAATGSGTWQIKLDGTTDWAALGAVSGKAPKFLHPLDRIRFVPAAGALGSAKVKFKAWDGALVSKATETGTLLVTIDPTPPANTAPVLDTAPAPAFLPALEDTKSPFGDTALALLGQTVTDPDALALRGIAVTGLTGTANGTWQFSTTNGKTWKPVGLVSDSSALLLRDLDKLRFLPAKDFNGSATVTYRAWDRTRGAAGARADVRLTGGSTPFSAAVETATAAVHAVNDAPVLNTKPVPHLTPVLPTATDPPGDLVSSLIGTNPTDTEGDPIGIAVTATSGPGTWQHREAGSPDWATIIFVAPTFPKYLAPADRIRFVPTAGLTGVAKIAYQAWDGALTSLATESASLVVNGTDDRPVLNTAANPALTPVATGTTNPPGDLVSALLGAATDADPGSDLGIAVTGAAGVSGTWEVMVNGTTWEALGPVSSKAPRRLKRPDRIRFVPAAGFVGAVKLSFKAWDAGSVNPTGANALSAATETAVVVVNTAPVLQT